MQFAINVLEIVLGFLLIGSILLQARGTGLSSTFGGASLFYRSKRGAEKMLFVTTIILASLFAASSLFAVILIG